MKNDLLRNQSFGYKKSAVLLTANFTAAPSITPIDCGGKGSLAYAYQRINIAGLMNKD